MNPEEIAPPSTNLNTDNKKLPSAFKLFQPSKDAVVRNIWTFIGLALIPSVPVLLTMGGGSSLGEESTAALGLLGVGTLLAMVLGLLLFPAISLTQLRAAEGKKIAFLDAVKAGLPYLWRIVGLAILTGLVILVGFLLLIVPGFIMIRRYILAPYYLIDHNLGVGEAMRRSAADSVKFSGAIWGVIGVSILCALPGVVPVLGQLISTVLGLLYSVAPALRYLEIKAATK